MAFQMVSSGPTLGHSLGPVGRLDFDPIGDFFAGASANSTIGMKQTVKNRSGMAEEKKLQLTTDDKGQVLEHYVQVGFAAQQQNAMQQQVHYSHAPSGMTRGFQERSIGEQAVRQIYETNKVSGEERTTELCKGVAELQEFNAVWNQHACLMPALNAAAVALPGGLVMAPPDPAQRGTMMLPAPSAQGQAQLALPSSGGSSLPAPPASQGTSAILMPLCQPLPLQPAPSAQAQTALPSSGAPSSSQATSVIPMPSSQPLPLQPASSAQARNALPSSGLPPASQATSASIMPPSQPSAQAEAPRPSWEALASNQATPVMAMPSSQPLPFQTAPSAQAMGEQAVLRAVSTVVPTPTTAAVTAPAPIAGTLQTPTPRRLPVVASGAVPVAPPAAVPISKAQAAAPSVTIASEAVYMKSPGGVRVTGGLLGAGPDAADGSCESRPLAADRVVRRPVVAKDEVRQAEAAPAETVASVAEEANAPEA